MFFDFFVIFCAKYLPYVVATIFALFALFSKRDFLQKIYFITTPFLVGGLSRLVFELLRVWVARPRPFVASGLEPLIGASGFSFPSGHALFWFAFSAVVFGLNKKIGVACFFVSAVICVFRVIAGVHYFSDILGGAVLGAIFGFLIFKLGVAFFDKRVKLWA